MLPPRGSAGARSRAGSSPDTGLSMQQLPRSPASKCVACPVLSWGVQGTSSPPRDETVSRQIPTGNVIPGKVPAGLHGPRWSMGKLSSLLRHLVHRWAFPSHQGSIFICHWVICGGDTGLAARSSQHPHLAFTSPSPAVGGDRGFLLSPSSTGGLLGYGTLSTLPDSSCQVGRVWDRRENALFTARTAASTASLPLHHPAVRLCCTVALSLWAVP